MIPILYVRRPRPDRRLPLFNSTGTKAGSFTGTFTPTSFSVANRAPQVSGQLVGTETAAMGGATQTAYQTITTTVQSAQANGTCNILNLALGPLDLKVLGLVVDLNRW